MHRIRLREPWELRSVQAGDFICFDRHFHCPTGLTEDSRIELVLQSHTDRLDHQWWSQVGVRFNEQQMTLVPSGLPKFASCALEDLPSRNCLTICVKRELLISGASNESDDAYLTGVLDVSLVIHD